MTHVTLKGTPTKLNGHFPKVGDALPNFNLSKNDLTDVNNTDFKQKFIILNIFISQDTPVCALSLEKFNEVASKNSDCAILCISKDLPFSFERFCTSNNIQAVTTLSSFRDNSFGTNFGVDIADGPLRGLLARAIIVANQERKIIYTELVPEITDEPNYNQCLAALET